MADRLDGLVLCRILPGSRFLGAIESDDHEAILGRGALNAFNLAAANEVMTVVRLQRVRNLGPDFAKVAASWTSTSATT
jgi:hypothetical protein